MRSTRSAEHKISAEKMSQTIYDEKRQQWHGLEKRPLYNPEATLGGVLLKSMQTFGPNIAQVSYYY